jgi:hypothetical protein
MIKVTSGNEMKDLSLARDTSDKNPKIPVLTNKE